MQTSIFSQRVREGILARLQEFEDNGVLYYTMGRSLNGIERSCHRYFARILRGEEGYLETSLERADHILDAHHRASAASSIMDGFSGLHCHWVSVLAAIVLYIQSEFSTFHGSRHLFLLLAEELLDLHGRGSYRNEEVPVD